MGENGIVADKRTLTAEVMEGVGLITINVPRTNAATAETWSALVDTLGRFEGDPAVRVVVITGAGHMAFVTDPDAAEMEAQAVYDQAARQALEALGAFAKPSIARVRGDCIGAGLLLALYCDIVVAAEDSAFALPGARWGAAYPPAAVARLRGLVGPQHALRMLYAGGRLEAAEALRIGLATLVTADTDLSTTVAELAQSIAENAPLAVAAAKRMVAKTNDPALAGLVEQCRRSQDYADAIAAMQQHRPVRFHGR